MKSALRTPDQPSIRISRIVLTFSQKVRYDRTNGASEIRSLEDLDAQVWQDLAHDLGSVVELEMCVLGSPVSHSHSMRITASLFPMFIGPFVHLHTACVLHPDLPPVPPCVTELG